jgi:MATE family multidrug resistance protein
MASCLGIVSLGAHSIALTINTFLFVSFPFAIGNAASILVGTFIGEAKPIEAKKSFRVSLFFSYITQLIVISLLLCWRIELGKLFSNDDEVSNVVSRLIPIMCVFLINDASVATSGGVFRGLGRQKWILRINLFGSWILAMPVAYCLAFKTNLEVYGLWWGMSVGVIFSAITCQYILNFQVKWQRECRNAAERLSSIHFTDRSSSAEPLLHDRAMRHQVCEESDPAHTLT